MLIEPNPESALNEEAGRLFMEDYKVCVCVFVRVNIRVCMRISMRSVFCFLCCVSCSGFGVLCWPYVLCVILSSHIRLFCFVGLFICGVSCSVVTFVNMFCLFRWFVCLT